MFTVCNHDQHDTSITLTIANQSEVSNEQYVSVPCFSSIQTRSEYLLIYFALYDIKSIPFFERYIQNISIPDFFMHFKRSFNDQPTIALFTTLIEKNLTFISFKNQISSGNQPTLNPTLYKHYTFYWKIQKLLRIKLKIMNHFLLNCLKLFFYHNLNGTSPSWKFHWRILKLRAQLFVKTTVHMASLPTGILGYIELPITTVKPCLYKFFDIRTLIHPVVHTYHPQRFEPINVHY